MGLLEWVQRLKTQHVVIVNRTISLCDNLDVSPPPNESASMGVEVKTCSVYVCLA